MGFLRNKSIGVGRLIFLVVLVCVLSRSGYGAPWAGSGDANDPYQIWTAADMQAIGADANYWDAHFLLCADIDLSAYTGTSFNIIGNDVNAFSGSFDGNSHTISNFTYDCDGINYIGLFGYIDDPNAEVKGLGLIAPDIDAGSGEYVGALIGRFEGSTIRGCYVEGGSVSGRWYVGGLVGNNWEGCIQGCYSTGGVSGIWPVGGLVGRNFYGDIQGCYSTGDVTGRGSVGGLVGWNHSGDIQGCNSTGDVEGEEYVGGLVGYNDCGDIQGCYSVGEIEGVKDVGGLVGYNRDGYIQGSYSAGDVTGGDYAGGLVGENSGYIQGSYSTGGVTGEYRVGGLVGDNWGGYISICYSTGGVTGENFVGGLVGYGSSSYVTDSFWDIETSGLLTSAGGTGLSTVLMQTESTFVNAGWDFVTPIWQMCDLPDYPKLAWEICPVEMEMEVTPAMLNCGSSGDWVKAHFVLPEGYLAEDVDVNTPAVAEPVGLESEYIEVLDEGDGYYRIVAVFDREGFCEALGGDAEKEFEVTVSGEFTDGAEFYGTDTIKLISDQWQHRNQNQK